LVCIFIIAYFLMAENRVIESQSPPGQLDRVSTSDKTTAQNSDLRIRVNRVEEQLDRHVRKSEPYLILLLITLIVITIVMG